MARVLELSVEDMASDHRKDFIKFHDLFASFGNLVPVYAHAPIGMKHVFGMSVETKESKVLPERLIEIAVVAASYANRCSYCVIHHSTILAELGLAKESISNLNNDDVSGLSEIELLVKDYAIVVTERAWGIKDEMFEKLKKHFTDSQIVELTMRIGLTGLFNKVNQALDIEMEDDLMGNFINKGLSIGKFKK